MDFDHLITRISKIKKTTPKEKLLKAFIGSLVQRHKNISHVFMPYPKNYPDALIVVGYKDVSP
jgi:hypothetical protein